MQGDVNSAPGRLSVVGSKIQEGIKRCGRVRIQEGVPQSRLADFANGQVLPLVPGVTEACFPVPRLEIIAKFSHFTTQPNVEQRILVGELFMSGTSVVNATKPNARSHRKTRAVRKEIWNGRIRHCERIKRIHNRHTDAAAGAKAYVSAWSLEWIGAKRHSCNGRIEKRTDIFEVGEQR